MIAVRPREWLGGMGLSASFFLPIAAGLEIEHALFMWTWRHSLELLCAWLLLALAFTAALVRSRRTHGPRLEAIGLVALGALPALSVIAVTGRSIRQLFGDASVPAWTAQAGTLALALLALLALALLPALVARGLRRLYACGALLLIPLVHFGVTAMPRASPDAHPPPRQTIAATCGDVYVLLFDELSYSAIFPPRGRALPHMQALADSATVYHNAISPPPDPPGSSVNTLDAVDAYLGSASDAVADGPIGLARRAGYHTEVAGWYFPYCASLGGVADRCHDHSLYNASAASGSFSLIAPFETAINIWPYQLPTGLLKRPVARLIHGHSLDDLVRDITAPPAARPAFRWVHFNVPHSPWFHDAGVFAIGAFAPTPERYARQVEEADRALGRVMASIDSRGEMGDATIVLIADHASRDGFADDQRHVPLMIRSPAARHADRREPVKVADVLRSVARETCTSSATSLGAVAAR